MSDPSPFITAMIRKEIHRYMTTTEPQTPQEWADLALFHAREAQRFAVRAQHYAGLAMLFSIVAVTFSIVAMLA